MPAASGAFESMTETASYASRATPNRARTIVICAILLLAGAAVLALIFSTEPEAQRETAVRETAMLVTVTRPESGTFRPLVNTVGTVRPAREVMLSPRVMGEVTVMADAFVPGGFVDAGDVLLRIDPADYRAALRQAESELLQAVADLEIEQGRQDLAERDYRELQRELAPDKEALVLRRPHLRSAEANVEAAEAAAERARLNLQRTSVVAPFDAQVLERTVNLGSQVDVGEPLARLAGVQTYWIETTIPLDKLRWLSFDEGETGQGSPVSVRHRAAWAEGEHREGHLFRLIGELEGETRLARALIAVDDPLARVPEHAGAPSLIIGAFVECAIEGQEITDALRLPRDTIRSGDTVWVMRDGRLAIEPVDIVFEDATHAYIRGGLVPEDRVVTSSLATVREGAPLRVDNRAEVAVNDAPGAAGTP